MIKGLKKLCPVYSNLDPWARKSYQQCEADKSQQSVKEPVDLRHIARYREES